MTARAQPTKLRVSPLTVLPVVIYGGLAAVFFWGLFNNDDRLPSALIGKAVPVFDLPSIDGRSDGLATTDLAGEVCIVNVWASWCVPCRVEMPLLVELVATSSVPIYGINHRDPPGVALAFLDELGVPYTRIEADRNGRTSIDWGVYGLPETFVIDGEGRIAYKHVGAYERRALEEEILPVVRRLQAENGT